MLRTNLSTRPFYNERLVRIVLGLFGAAAIGLMLFNVLEILRLRGQSSEARTTVANNEVQSRELRQKAQTIRQAIDKVKLDAVQTAAREANLLIDSRTFSWTELLNYFETTLPPNVRITGVAPSIDNGRRQLAMTVVSKRIEDLEEFMDALEKTGAFTGVLPRSDSFEGEGNELRTQLIAYYTPLTAEAAAAPAPASEPGSEQAAKDSAPGNLPPAAPAAPKPAPKDGPR